MYVEIVEIATLFIYSLRFIDYLELHRDCCFLFCFLNVKPELSDYSLLLAKNITKLVLVFDS